MNLIAAAIIGIAVIYKNCIAAGREGTVCTGWYVAEVLKM